MKQLSLAFLGYYRIKSNTCNKIILFRFI